MVARRRAMIGMLDDDPFRLAFSGATREELKDAALALVHLVGDIKFLLPTDPDKISADEIARVRIAIIALECEEVADDDARAVFFKVVGHHRANAVTVTEGLGYYVKHVYFEVCDENVDSEEGHSRAVAKLSLAARACFLLACVVVPGASFNKLDLTKETKNILQEEVKRPFRFASLAALVFVFATLSSGPYKSSFNTGPAFLRFSEYLTMFKTPRLVTI